MLLRKQIVKEAVKYLAENRLGIREEKNTKLTKFNLLRIKYGV